MELHQLKIFMKVASLNNFTRAAEQLGYSQSNVSAQIRQLEEEVGRPLFDRIGKKVSLTVYGRQLMPYAGRLLSEAGEIEYMFREDSDICAALRIGMVESLFNMLFVPAVIGYHERFPGMKIDLTIDSTDALIEMMEKDMLDLACVVHDPFAENEWNSRVVRKMPVVIICSSRSSLAEKESLHLADLCDREFVMMEESAPYSTYFRHKMAGMGIPFRSFLTLQDPEMACRLAAAGDFLSVVPKRIAADHEAQGKIKILTVEDFSYTQYAQVILHRNRAVTPPIEGFLEELDRSF